MKHIIALLIAVLFVAPLVAQIPETIPIQGQLFQRDGSPLPDGDYEMEVTLYDQETGGTGIKICAPCTVPMNDGVFQVVLGEDEQLPLPSMDQPWWVALTVNGEELQPRIKLHAVPYAHEAINHPPSQTGLPIGSIVAFAGPPPNNQEEFMIADGRALSSNDYPRLFSAIGRTWGSGGDGGTDETDFNLPDLRGIFLRGDDMGSGRDNMLISRTYHAERANDTSTVGSYYGVDNMKFTSEMGQIHASREGGFISVGSGLSGSSWANTALYTPNAAVVYMIKVK